ncbi:D-alanyl-D-alanine carboxypeptidase family protein [Terracoccus sp. 273MFTsu3.1]|uniref:D-alanyl-D-alanine carboxypeptidase family protein n=1 Tax=Terracoccus sp. 273MFTsu3.1 TaxID=1172188 RepID=UPI0003A2A58A|nr:serine hydrolase [Terracoccus sp. 273MFTsu3.1]
MTPRDPARHRPWTVPVAGAALSALGLGLALTTAYAVPPASVTPLPRVAPAAAPVAAPTCAPWQTRQAVPVGVTLTPRVFPTDEPAARASTARPSVTSSATTSATSPATAQAPVPVPRPTGSTTPAKPPKVRVVCRNAPPTPFAHPAWKPETVVGGSRLAESGVVVDRPASVPAPPEVYDVSYVVADLDTGEVLAAKSPHAWLRPASTLKTLTALTLMPRLDPRRVVVAGQDAQDAAGSRVGILAGNRYPVSSLFDAMLMFSANDAVYALADAAGGYAATVELMNVTAREVGAHDTLTVDPSGLDDGAQRSSAYDLALIGRDAMRLPAFRATITKRDSVFPGGKDKHGKVWPAFHVYNINELLRHYPGAVGIKPGRTDRAQHTFIGAATRGGRTLVVAQMGSITGSWKPTAALLDWGFANADRVTPVGRLVEPGEAAAPAAAPELPVLPSDGATGTGVGSGTLPGTWAGTGTPAPVAAPASETTASDRTRSLVVLAAAGVVVTIGVVLLAFARRRRRTA